MGMYNMSFKDSLKAFSPTPEENINKADETLVKENLLANKLEQINSLYHNSEAVRRSQERHINHLRASLTWSSLVNIVLSIIILSDIL